MKKIKKIFLIVVYSFVFTGFIHGATTINLTVCEGGNVSLKIPDCTVSDRCCITWIDLSTNLEIPFAYTSCNVGRGPFFENNDYKAIVTKDKLGSTEEYIFRVKVIDPSTGSFSVEPKACCYSAGEPITLDDFDVSFETPNTEYENVVFTATNVSPSFAATYEDQQVGLSPHIVTFTCHESEQMEEVMLDVVNESIEIPTNTNLSLDLDLTYKRALKKKIPKPQTNKLFSKMIELLPVFSLNNSVEEVKFKKCCKEREIACISDNERMKFEILKFETGVGGSDPITDGLTLAEVIQSLNAAGFGLTFPFNDQINADVDIEYSATVVTNSLLPAFTFETGCDPDLKECITWGSTLKLSISLTPKVNVSGASNPLIKGPSSTSLSITWPQELKYCWPGGFQVEATDYRCPTITIEGKAVLSSLIQAGHLLGKEEFYPSIFGIDCQ